MEKKPAYWKPLIPSQKRRAAWHDYHSRCMYMVTIGKAEGAPDFGRLSGTGIELSACGRIIEEEIKSTPAHNPQVTIMEMVVMPDHLHFLAFVREPIKKHFGDIIQAFKAAATRRIRNLSSDSQLTVFQEGFHDRIITRAGQREAVARYILDNPRRLAVRRENPEYFRLIRSLVIDGHEYRAYGNPQLLDNPFKEQVVVHRADSDNLKEQNRQRWLYTAAGGGILVSPFISRAEKEIRAEAETLGGRFILIVPDAFSERYKPFGTDFSLCEQGRLLIISAPSGAKALSREACLAMNALAARLVNG